MAQCTDFKNSIDPDAADRLISAHDGDVALLYIHAVRNGVFDADRAARDLCRTLGEIGAAEEKLRRLDLLPDLFPAPVVSADPAPAAQKLPPADELPEYRTEDILKRTQEDSGFSAVVQEANRVFGHSLSSNDLKRLFGIYDYLAMPAEVIYMLLHHCANLSSGRRLSMRFVEKEAYSWVNREIYTLEQAEKYIAQYRSRNEETNRIAAIFGIRGRELTAAEKKYIGAWIEMGFEDSALNEAYERTVLSTGKFTWNYMNRILQSWHENGIHTLSDAESRDPRRTKPSANKPKDSGGKIDLAALIEATKDV